MSVPGDSEPGSRLWKLVKATASCRVLACIYVGKPVLYSHSGLTCSLPFERRAFPEWLVTLESKKGPTECSWEMCPVLTATDCVRVAGRDRVCID